MCTIEPREAALASDFFLEYLELFPKRAIAANTFFIWRNTQKIFEEKSYVQYKVDGELHAGTAQTLTIPASLDHGVEFVTFGRLEGTEVVSTMRCPGCLHVFSGYGTEYCPCGLIMCACGNIWDGNAQCLCDNF